MNKFLVIPLVALGYYIFHLIFDLPVIEHVLALMFLGYVLSVIFRGYDGFVEIELDPGGIKKVSLVVEGDPETLLERKHELIFKVKKDSS